MAKKRKRSRLIILGAIVLLMIVGFAWKQSNRSNATKVFTEKVEKRSIVEKVAASGKIFPETEIKISSNVSGDLVQLLVQEGDSVARGQLLAKIDPEAIASQVERGKANVNSAKAQLSNARAQIGQFKAQKEQIEAQLFNARKILERNRQLKADGAISEADYETALVNVQTLEANKKAADANIQSALESIKAAEYSVKSAEATLREIQTSLNKTTITAPTNGIISKLNVEEGEQVLGTIQMQGTELMRIANLNLMEVRVDVSETSIPKVELGDVVEIEIDAYLNRKFTGKVTQIAHSANNSSMASLTNDQVTNFEVRINIDPESYTDLVNDNNRYPFRPGMSANVEIITNKKDGVLSVPIQAVTSKDKNEEENKIKRKLNEENKNIAQQSLDVNLEEVVFVVSADSVVMRKVVTGIQDADYIEIISGLDVDEDVVAGPYTAIARELKEGDKVEPMSKDEFYKTDNK